MHTHRIDSFLVTDNIRLEIVHESNPYFAGEPISLVVRLKHLGSQNELLNLKEGIRELHQQVERKQEQEEQRDNLREDEGRAWSMKSLLNAFKGENNTSTGGTGMSQAEFEKNSKIQEQISKQLQFHKSIDLISGYVQISGALQFDPEAIDESKLEHASTKKIGIDNFLNHATGDKLGAAIGDGTASNSEKGNLAKYFNSKYNASTIGLPTVYDERDGLKGDATPVFALGNMSTAVEYQQLPIFLIPQTLLFSEMLLEAGKTKSFRFKSNKLPNGLAPSYNISKNISIGYNFEFGVSRLVLGEIKQYSVRVPINISPYVNSVGSQYTSILNQTLIIMEPGNVKEFKQKPSAQKRPSTASLAPLSRRSSSFMGVQEKNDDAEKVIQNFITLVESNQNGFKDMDDLVESQVEMQFPNYSSEETSNITAETTKDDQSIYTTKKSDLVSNNISNLYSLSTNYADGEPAPNAENGLIPQLTNLQKSYQINWNGQPITKLLLSKLFYTTSDDIDLVLQLDPNSPPLHKVSAVTVSLEAFEIINRKYAADVENLGRPHGTQVYESHAICFDTCDCIPVKMVLPKTPMNQLPSQFRTDVFQFKWMLILKFVLVPRVANISLEQFYEDKKGVLFHAKETLDGEEFSCHIPLPLLPSAHNFGGW